MTMEIVDLPIKNGDFPVRYVSSPEGTPSSIETYFDVVNPQKNYIIPQKSTINRGHFRSPLFYLTHNYQW